MSTFCWLWTLAAAGALDLSSARLVVPAELSKPEENAVAMFLDEVETRARIRIPLLREPVEAPDAPRIALSLQKPARTQRPIPPEGFRIRSSAPGAPGPASVEIHAADSRGVLFGLGYLLRKLSMSKGRILLDGRLDLETAPATPLRGHQLGYRPKTNSYDAWDLPQWRQYYRDLAVFGSNAVELVPPKSDDDDQSPHFPRPKMEMMIGMSKLADDYGLDVWIWYPALDGDYADPEVVERSLREWGEVLEKLPRVDALFVPTGDPGRTRPSVLMPFLEKQNEQLVRLHPKARMWISVQSLTQEWWDEMTEILDARPEWLAGVGFGPQTRVSLPRLRAALPARYPIRRYPDITHCMWCQYPVPDWDVAFPLTEGREGVNPRPVDQRIVYRAFMDYAQGFITYSEGCNDDVNKMVWSGLGWDPDADVVELLRDYSRYFLGPELADDFAQGLLALERNWRGALLTNAGVDATLAQFRDMERRAGPALLANWRFQQALYRAYYDAFVRSRRLHEAALERRAMDALRHARAAGSLEAMEQAEAILDEAKSAPVAQDLRARVFDLAEDLYQSIRMQLSVPKYKAIAVWRGANLDSIDVPLNNLPWLRGQFTRIRKLPSEQDRLAALDEIVHWTNPGPGGFYDDLGDPANQPRLVREGSYEQDPGYLASPYVGFELSPGRRLSWTTYVDGLYDVPVVMKYTDLDPDARYRVRVVYAGDNYQTDVRLVADDGVEIHPWMKKPAPTRPIEFDVPHLATRDGTLTLTWTADPKRGGNGRGVQVAEVWLIKAPEK